MNARRASPLLGAVTLLLACQTHPARPGPSVAPEPPSSAMPDPLGAPVNRQPGELLAVTVRGRFIIGSHPGR